MKQAKEMSAGDDKFARFKAFEQKRKEGKDDYTHDGKLEFVQANEEENKKQEQAKVNFSPPPPSAAPQSTPAVESKGPAPTGPPQNLGEMVKQVFYFDGEDMVKRDAMVQLADDNAEYPYLHVHTADGTNIDPVTGETVTVVKGYAQQPSSLTQLNDDNAEYPFLHVHTESGDDVDPVHRQIVNPTKGYAQKDEQSFGKQLKRIVAIWDWVG